MEKKASLDGTYIPSQDVVAREIQGELIIIPITSGMGDLEDEMYTLNQTGRAIWNELNGKRTLKDAVAKLSLEFTVSPQEIERDVLGLAEELLKRKMLVAVKRG